MKQSEGEGDEDEEDGGGGGVPEGMAVGQRMGSPFQGFDNLCGLTQGVALGFLMRPHWGRGIRPE